MTITAVLISGANRGIGYGFVKNYLSRPQTTVVATVRNPSAAESQALLDLPHGQGSKILLIQVENTSDTDATEAAQSLLEHGIDKLDIVIANSGIFRASAHHKVAQMRTDDLLDHVNVNAVGVVRLFQAVLPLLQKTPKKPIFVVNSAGAATIAGMEAYADFPLNSYAASKALVNFMTRKIHFENEELIVFAIHPGQVVTETRTSVARTLGAPVEGISIDECVNSVVGLIDKATREETSGKFWSVDGTVIPW